FSHSAAARTEAAAYFPEEVIERGLEYSFERRLLYWPLVALRLAFLVALVTTGLARKVTDRCHAWTGGRWLATVVLVGGLYFVVDELLSLPFAIARFQLGSAWEMTNRPLSEWLGDHLKETAVSIVTDGIVLVGLYLLLRKYPRRWWLAATAGGAALGAV